MTKIITLRGDTDDHTDDGGGSDDVDGNEDGDKKISKLFSGLASRGKPGDQRCNIHSTLRGSVRDNFLLCGNCGNRHLENDDDILFFCHPSSKYLMMIFWISAIQAQRICVMVIFWISAIQVQHICVMMIFCISAIQVQSICVC